MNHSLISSNAKFEPRAILIADDLTGACDSGLGFAIRGLSVSVRLNTNLEPGESEALTDVIALLTETRNLGAEEAENRLLQCGDVSRFHGSLLFRKVDSAGRGNPGIEILVTLRLAKCDAVVYAPAFPAAGRTVLNGILRVQDVSGQDAELNLPSLFRDWVADRVALIPIQDSASLRDDLLHAQAAGKHIWIFDSQQQDDLCRIARVASALSLHLLLAASAGLANAIAELMKTERRFDVPAAAAKSARGCSLLFSGTTHPVTSMQLNRLAPYASALTLDGEQSLPPVAEWCCLRGTERLKSLSASSGKSIDGQSARPSTLCCLREAIPLHSC